MVKTKLVAGLIDDGSKVLRELDRQNFPVDSMFWIHLPDDDYWNNAFVQARLSCDVSASELMTYWEAERKISSDPRLLISSQDVRWTLRFHPRHGDLPEIENLKRAFEIALHKPNARPGCRVEWLD